MLHNQSIQLTDQPMDEPVNSYNAITHQ